MSGRTKRRHALRRWRGRLVAATRWCGAQVRSAWAGIGRWLRPWEPEVLVDAKRGRARRLRRAVKRATLAQFHALGVMPPRHLLIVVQRTVQGDGPLASLLQVYEDAQATRRHVLFLAMTVGEDPLSDGAIVATLRQQLHEVVGDALGSLVCSVPAQTQPRRWPAAITPLHPQASEPPPYADEEAPPPDDTWQQVDDGAYAVVAER